MELERIVTEYGGIVRRQDLAARMSMSPRTLERNLAARVAAGTLTRPRRGLYAVPGADPVDVLAASVGGRVSCVSFALRHGLPLLDPPSELHVSVPPYRSGRVRAALPPGTVVHWNSHLDPDRFPRPPSAAVALLPLVRCLPRAEAVAVFDAALAQGLVEERDLWRLRPTRGWARFERVMRRVDPRSASIAESIGRVALLDAGFDLEVQVSLTGVGVVDLLVEGLVVVEIDGFAYHSGRAEFRNDRRRDRIIAIDHGLMELRFAFEDVVYDLPGFVATVERAVAVAGARRAASA